MNRTKFRESLLEFLSDVTSVPDDLRKAFIELSTKCIQPAPDGFGTLNAFVLIKEGPIGADGKYGFMMQVKLYTENNVYFIVAIHRTVDGGPYLSCTVDTRKSKAGENWTRGRDLVSGDFSKATWRRIKDRILETELVRLSTYLTGGHYTGEGDCGMADLWKKKLETNQKPK